MSDPTPTPIVRAFVFPETKAINEKTREIMHLISTPSEDRAGDVVEPAGADLANYLKNPVVLADHDYSIKSIIGRATSMTVEEDGIFARTQFHDEGLGRDAFNLVKNGMAKAWSIGFRPKEYEAIKDEDGKHVKGFRFSKWELLEYSLVAVPMNPDAVHNAVKRGIVQAVNVPALFRYAEIPITEPKPADSAAPSEAKADAPRWDERVRLAALRDLRDALSRHNIGAAMKGCANGARK